MMNDHQTALCSLLLGSFPNFSSGDSEGALAAYELVMSAADERDLQPGIMLLINGEYPGHDGRFAPTAPQLAGAIRRCRDARLESQRRHQLRIAPPSMDDVSDEERARVKAGFDDLAARLSERLQTQETAHHRHKALLNKANARFAPDMSDRAVRRRLGFSAGDPDDHEAAA